MAINNTVENINNQPTIQPQQVTGAFLRYIAKTIPLAFDESMSYYECICALRDYINQFIDNLNNVNDGLGELQAFYEELQSYVNDYFDNLDVQEEINNKLDHMAEDGSLTALIKAYVDPIYEEYEDGINNRIETIENKVNTSVGVTPIAVSSTSEMTDTTKLYVNTTDGKWYYFNGTNWTAGGTYQSSGIGLGSVSYNNLSDLLKRNLLKKVSPSNLIWVEGVGRYNGNVVTDNAAVSSQLFIVTEGTTITCSNETTRVRYTFYDIDGTYIGNTGTYVNTPSYQVQQDCWLCISTTLENNTKDEVASFYSCDCYIPNNQEIKFNFYLTYTSKIESEAIYVTKGTKISTIDYGVYTSSNTLSDSSMYIGYNKYGLDKYSHNYVNYGLDTNYSNQEIIIDEDCYIRLYIRFKANKTILETDLPKLQNAIKISYINSYGNNFLDTDKYRVYISNNGDIELFEESQYVYFRIINPNNELIIKKDKSTIFEKSFTDILSDLSSYANEYNGHNYIRLPYSRALYYSLFSNELKVNNLDTDSVGEKNIYLLVNAYGNLLDCELLTLYLKKMNSATNIFNSGDYITSINWKNKIQELTYKLISCSNNIETFTFFTDPHLMGSATNDFSSNLNKYIGTLQKFYNSSPMNFIVGGGDWLNNNDTPQLASLKLGYVDGFMNSMFKNYHGILGNHDTNYQGSESLTTDELINLWYRKEKSTYYSFDGINTKCYCLDSGKDNNLSMDSYRWNQIKWLGDKLLEDDPEHAIVFSHIITHLSELSTFADNFTKLIKAYNDHDTITLNSIDYNFTNCTGHVDYVLGGHTHSDSSDTYNGVLCIITTTFGYNQTTPTFDMVINDYDDNKAYFIRVGNGESREFNI